jgi:hypothetical protein
MRVLRISEVPVGTYGNGARRIEVHWQDGSARQIAASSFTYRVEDQDAERIRWYLEDFAEFPADPAPGLANAAESQLAQIGTDLFRGVFSSQDAASIWAHAAGDLGRVRVEVDADPADAAGLPWELLREPETGDWLALEAGAFVRTHRQAVAPGRGPELEGRELRVLLVICRPDRGNDVPFRSVARRLVRGGAGQADGLELDVLRPATFSRLREVLHTAADAGRPYHVVHFDGHGVYLDLTGLVTAGQSGGHDRPSAAEPVRAGRHGYLVFEDPASSSNRLFADGPALGRLLAATGVPVLLLNACRSAYAENDAGPEALLADAHGRIHAYGSLAAEVADAGVPGVVAMRYNVYVVTAAQFTADLYAGLLTGQSLGEATTAARRALAANPDRQVGAELVALQDWAVPVVYEAAPLTLVRHEGRKAAAIVLSGSDGGAEVPANGVPSPPDAGFFGQDETLLALDRAFDSHKVVLLQAFAGAGKSAVAAEFARWYAETGGLDDGVRPERGPGQVMWSTFERYLSLERLLDAAGDRFAGLLEADGTRWRAVDSLARRRTLVLQVLAQVPTLWVWDNVEPVTGFPAGSPSLWTTLQQQELLGFLRDLAERTQCRVLLISRRDEHGWLADVPVRVTLPPMPMRERIQLAAAIAMRNGGLAPKADLRPLLRYTAGNPLTITVLVGQALRENIPATAGIEAFVSRVRDGEAAIESVQDEELGRTRSLAASLGYGLAHSFSRAERDQLAVLHLFQETVSAGTLEMMGHPEYAIPQLSGITMQSATGLLDRAAEIGLLGKLYAGTYSMHPALPWYFASLFTSTYSGADGDHALRAYIAVFAGYGEFLHQQYGAGGSEVVIAVLTAEESNLRYALELARRDHHGREAVRCVQGLRRLYRHTGRHHDWACLLAQATTDNIDPATDGPLPGCESEWSVLTSYRVREAFDARDWNVAARLGAARVAWHREQAAPTLALGDDQLAAADREEIRSLAVAIEQRGHVLRQQQDVACLTCYHEAIGLFRRIGGRIEAANIALALGHSYLNTPGMEDVDQAQSWYQYSLENRPVDDQQGRAGSIGGLAAVLLRRFNQSIETGAAKSVSLGYLNGALQGYQLALALTSPDNADALATAHSALGRLASIGMDDPRARPLCQAVVRHPPLSNH